MKNNEFDHLDLSKITGITSDSKLVEPGFAFVAIKGEKLDGHDFIKIAIEKGASLIVVQEEVSGLGNVPYIKVSNTRAAFSELSSLIYPKQPRFILGVTGTSGKSSTVNFIREILKLLGKKAISIGSLGVLGDIEYKPSSLNTPTPDFLHKLLNRAVNENIDYVAIECSSHGIVQHRIDSLKLYACGFTNFSQDHLDYHKNMEEYFAAKMQIFSIMKPGFVVLNSDINEFKEILNYVQEHQIITYGRDSSIYGKIKINSIKLQENSQLVDFVIDGKLYSTQLFLLGEFQVCNLACAIGLLMTTGLSIEEIFKTIPMISTVPGRLELAGVHNDAKIFIDHAHKPDALKNVLMNVRKFTKGNLWVVFGCGGDRDALKRPLMGQIACEYADKIIITDDNPRYEDPNKIRKAIIDKCYGDYIEIADRGNAIEYAVRNLCPGDCLIVAGKGHENYQIIGNEEIYFSDCEVVRKLLDKLDK